MSSDRTTLGDRMKGYEGISRHYLSKRIPVIVRIDGKAFHTVTRKSFGKKWSQDFTSMMVETAKAVQKEMSGCSIAYCQSDEITFLITDYKTISTSPWFDYNVQKLSSVSASIAASTFSLLHGKAVSFDGRSFSIPQDEVANNFIWRQQDATRNAIQMAGYEYFSHKQLKNKSCNDIQEMLFAEKGINFNDYPTIRKRGFCIINGKLDNEIPIFSKDREYIEKHVFIRED
jgi:tRNA(His) 5'-end guanylyltransferase